MPEYHITYNITDSEGYDIESKPITRAEANSILLDTGLVYVCIVKNECCINWTPDFDNYAGHSYSIRIPLGDV